MNPGLLAGMLLWLAGCSSLSAPPGGAMRDRLHAEIDGALQRPSQAASLQEVQAALLPPMRIELPRAPAPAQERFSLSVVDLPAHQVLMALAADTRYTMLVHPDITGNITAELKDVTVPEALEALHLVHDFDYSIQGTRIVVRPAGEQTAVFQVNYLSAVRTGQSQTRVNAGSISETAGGTPGTPGGTSGAPSRASVTSYSSEVTTDSASDFWKETELALRALAPGGTVMVSPHSGVVVVRASKRQIRDIAEFLRALRVSVERQVILEAKILEVELSDQTQAGVNWAAFSRTHTASVGFAAPGTTLAGRGAADTLSAASGLSTRPGSTLGVDASALGALFGLAVQSSNFAALISFLDTQGTVHVLSSPRIATMNNQKAVLKVGSEDFYVTSLEPGAFSFFNNQLLQNPPKLSLQPFFSGVVLDVTPQIDGQGHVMLHVRPSVSEVSTVDRSINLGESGGTLQLPLASSRASETDSIIRARDGQVVVIGGLMRQAVANDRSQVTGLGEVPVIGGLFRNTQRAVRKRELVILLRPRIVESDDAWVEDLTRSGERLRGLDPARRLP